MEAGMKLERKKARQYVVEFKTLMGEPGMVMATEWPNGEGHDVTIADKVTISLHADEIDPLRLLLDAVSSDGHVPLDKLEKSFDGKQATVHDS